LVYQAEIWPEHTFGLVDYNYLILKNAQLCWVFTDPVTYGKNALTIVAK